MGGSVGGHFITRPLLGVFENLQHLELLQRTSCHTHDTVQGICSNTKRSALFTSRRKSKYYISDKQSGVAVKIVDYSAGLYTVLPGAEIMAKEWREEGKECLK